MVDRPVHEVGAAPGRQLAVAGAEAERGGGVAGHAGQRLFGRQPQQRAGHVQHQQRRQRRRRPRVVVGGDGDRHARGPQRVHRRHPRLAQEVERARQQHRHRARRRHRLDAGVRQVFEVVTAQRAEAGRQRRAAAVAELLGVQLDGQAERAGGGEHALDLRRREGDRLAEAVHGVDQPLRVPARQPPADGVDVVVRAAFEFGWQRVGGQRGGAHGLAGGGADLAGDAQAACLVHIAQAVARLDLQCRHALGEQGAGALHGTVAQRVVGRGARGGHGRADAATGAGDLLVACALQPQLELAGAVAAVDEVGVRVDQAGR